MRLGSPKGWAAIHSVRRRSPEAGEASDGGSERMAQGPDPGSSKTEEPHLATQ